MQKEYVDEVFQKIEKREMCIENVLFEDCVFENCVFEGVKLTGCSFSGCRFVDTQLLNLQFDRTQAIGNDFETCTLIGLDWSLISDERKRAMNLLPFDRLQKCVLRHCIFYGMDLTKTDLSESDLSGSYFDDCVLREARFRESELMKTSFAHCDLSGADFTRAKNYFFSLETNRVKGARFTLPEAIELLNALGVVIGDD